MHDVPTLPQPPIEIGIPDAQLLEAWVRHQRQADFTEIVRRHLGLVQGVARRQLDQDRAEDIAQRVFAILARKAASLTDLRSLAAWLHRVTLLECRSAVRSQIRDRRNREAAMETVRIADARDPLAEALPYLDAAIGDLSESDRELILLRYSEGLTFNEAAKRTGRNEAALRQQASRAVEKLSGMLRRRGVSVPAATLATGLGIHLAGTSTTSAAVMVSSAALTGAAGITGFFLAGITLLTMTAKQSILVGATLAAFLVAGPLIWRATQLHQAEQFLVAVSRGQTTVESAGSQPVPGKTRSTRDRSAKALSEVERMRMMAAIPGILETTLKETMNEWFERDAWLEARRTAHTLGLSDVMETDLRLFLISDRKQMIDGAMDFDGEKVDYAARRKDQDARLDAWFATRLTPSQEQGRQRWTEARQVALAGKLAATALQGITANIDLSEEQKSQLFDAAAAKATLTLEEKAYGNSISMGFRLGMPDTEVPLEERAQDYVRSVLDPGQQELWKVALERDRAFGATLQKRVVGGMLEHLKKVRLTPEELHKGLQN